METNHSEGFLVKNLSKGNIVAFNALYNKYGKRIFIFANGYLKSKSDSEELVQEVFTIIWEKRECLDKELSFKCFIFTIAFNLIRKHFRTNRCIEKYIRSQNNTDSDDNTVLQINCNSLSEYYSYLIEQLPCRRREIFIKSRVEGMSIKEISASMKISHKTVENQITTALRFFKKQFEKERSFND